jgi:predicted ATPase/transcriptional regulator with GAF, ATPase, and Fis domain
MLLPGYSVDELLRRGRRRVVYRGRREADGRAVVLKSSASEYPTPAETAALRREYEILRSLSIPGVIRAVELRRHDDRLTLVLEDAGLPLAGILVAGPLPLDRFFAIAIPMVQVLGAVHGAGLIHKDLNPNNLLIDRETGRLTLADFGTASRLDREGQPPSQPHLLEGTLAYLSPEQTGRMNREVDYRTDFYSLGVTWYEMLTGRLPFEVSEPMELIHHHIARTPISPSERAPGVPEALSLMVLRLMAKAPEDRYQSAEGIEADLIRYEREWRTTGGIGLTSLGQADVSERFILPQRLYGRATEVAQVQAAFERAARGGAELLLVSGYSGIGKTSLVHELYKSLAGHRGHFLSGKFDQLARDVPYGAMIQAFRELVRQLLSQRDEEVAAWGERLRSALGVNGQVVVDVVPELEHIIGLQPAVPVLDATATQHRFTLVFQQFVRAVAAPAHPLVVFFDDLQWADSGTLQLLPHFLLGHEARGLLVIGAFRDNEVTATHPMSLALQDLRARGATVVDVVLHPLDATALTELVGDALRAAPSDATPVAGAIGAKTGGNPFFVTQFLRTLHQDGLLEFDFGAGRWRADLDGIQRMQITENVVDLMTSRIQRLAPPAQRMLRQSACVGNRFDLETLGVVVEASPADAARDLWEAVEQGLVVPEQKSYGFVPDLAAGVPPAEVRFRFLHDRVQQAAYATIPEADRRGVHLKVGRLLLAHGGGAADPNGLFEVVNHLNYGRSLIEDPAERNRLMELNRAAGLRAKASAAYPSALAYFRIGTELLPEGAWETLYPMAFSLQLECAEAQYLCGQYPESEASFLAVLERSQTPEERADVTALLMVQYETMSRYSDAIESGRKALETLGVELPADPGVYERALAEEVALIERLMDGRPVSSLLDLPSLRDGRLRRALRLLVGCWAPAYICGAGSLFHLVAARMVRLSLEHGNGEASAFGYVAFATSIGALRGDYQLGYEFGQLAIALNQRLADRQLHAVIHHRFAALVNAMRQPYATSLPHAQEGVRTALEAGNLHVAGYAQFQQSWWGMLIEETLGAFLAKFEPTMAFLARLQNPAFTQGQQLILQWALALQGRTSGPASLTGPRLDEAEFLRTIGRVGIFRGLYYTLKLELLYTLGLLDEALQAARDGEAAAEVFVGSVWPVQFAFYHALTLAAGVPLLSPETQPAAHAKLDDLLARLAHWAHHAPENFGPLHHMAAAEAARVRGHPSAAVAAYEEALVLIAGQLTPRYRALANELHGRFRLERGQTALAAVLLREARFGYAQWGASAKVAVLDQHYGPLLAELTPAPARVGVRQTTDSLASAVDLEAVFQAAQAIGLEIDLDTLVDRLIHVVLKAAGADHGVLIMEQEGRPAVRVLGTIDRVRVLPDPGVPLEEASELPVGLVQFVRRSRESVVVDDAFLDPRWAGDPYVQRERPRAVLSTAVINQGALLAVLYVENRLTPGAFTPERVRVMQHLSAQAAVAIRNAALFAEVSRLRDRLQAENVYLQEEIKTQHGFEEIIGRSPALQHNLHQVEQVAPTAATVLIRGETGTGKELLARAIHRLSPRRDRPLVSVNCGAISAGLVESELFGHEKGAFTGAIARKVGRFELADGGTLFLDEIGDLSSELQVKLLRVLQEGEFERVGGTRTLKADVRVIAATHQDLAVMVQEGRFRSDLFYRLNVFPIDTPPLRARKEDIPLLARHFVLRHGLKLGKRLENIPREVMRTLESYQWPGNIRELANIIERSVIVSPGTSLQLGDWAPGSRQPEAEPDLENTLVDVERQAILRALEKTGWVVSGAKGAALLLGLKGTTLEARMKRLGIRRPAGPRGAITPAG